MVYCCLRSQTVDANYDADVQDIKLDDQFTRNVWPGRLKSGCQTVGLVTITTDITRCTALKPMHIDMHSVYTYVFDK